MKILNNFSKSTFKIQIHHFDGRFQKFEVRALKAAEIHIIDVVPVGVRVI